ncbi:hypothetical protein RND71_019093 [Anisodus tanguticus]|uniref:Uncharacterized protein n=1 Tax=Anisodus tanguticus TaxID=243964 RepID=A0AAE1S0A3_9SOLA|nr:hypothetical protein RND71_019093 [Anisodus tanguticus]
MALKRATHTYRPAVGASASAPMSRRARRSPQNLGREPGGAAVGADLGGSPRRRGGSLGKSYLFSFNTAHPGNGSAREVGGPAGRAPHVAWCPVRSRRPLKIRRTECRPRPVVLITASGLQGEQPRSMEQCRQGKSAKWIRNFGKRIGSRAGARGPRPEPVGRRRTRSSRSRGESGSPRAGRGTDRERLLRGLPRRRTPLESRAPPLFLDPRLASRPIRRKTLSWGVWSGRHIR